MPLYTTDLNQATVSYSAMELRAVSAEQHAAILQANLSSIQARQPANIRDVALIGSAVVNAQGQATTAEEQKNAVEKAKADMPLQAFIEAIGLAAAIGEASMPDRVIPDVQSSVKAYVFIDNGVLGIRLHQPEFGYDVGLSTTTFEIVKSPPGPGAPSPRNLYVVLEDKQAVFAGTFFAASPQAGQVATLAALIVAQTSAWTFPYLVQQATALATLETPIAQTPPAGARAPAAASFSAAVAALTALCATMTTKSAPVVGDLLALTAALDASTACARALVP